jgi:hypothetical protein
MVAGSICAAIATACSFDIATPFMAPALQVSFPLAYANNLRCVFALYPYLLRATCADTPGARHQQACQDAPYPF